MKFFVLWISTLVEKERVNTNGNVDTDTRDDEINVVL